MKSWIKLNRKGTWPVLFALFVVTHGTSISHSALLTAVPGTTLFPNTSLLWVQTVHFILQSPQGAFVFDMSRPSPLPAYEWRGISRTLDPVVAGLKKNPRMIMVASKLAAIESIRPPEEKSRQLFKFLNSFDAMEMEALVVLLANAANEAPELILQQARGAYAAATAKKTTAEALQAARTLESQLREYSSIWGNASILQELNRISDFRSEMERQFLAETAQQTPWEPSSEAGSPARVGVNPKATP